MDAYRVMTTPFCINVAVAIESFNIDNRAVKKAISDAKTWHARTNQREYLPAQRATSSRCTLLSFGSFCVVVVVLLLESF